ncbi:MULTISPECIES: NAD-glutamate dehydrogenase domain-containing protein [unclassified Novosphingobium]|uniref:NAD-glutamate dehydrogenase domain-containing protein n=1 Tax=unclassified Novosphingobium TaxID=2644732 RepID=UPI000ECC5C5F|nr:MULTISPECIES: NAD-glutamate dehydrogenase domain-containing protein [unclassified Novosphingobium]HCF25079.1 glutamate dehydrogenase [Novosphingobium sp.]HQV02305.1 NAD-glutamate dehydrogenase [Novosphingobium sp.]
MSSKSAPRPLVKALAQRLSDAMLPGDPPFAADGLAQAAEFTIAAAAQREPGSSTIAIESVSGAAGERFMRLALINDDMPFLVDSIASTIAAHGLAIDRLIHPVLPVRRDVKGKLIEIVAGDAAGEKRESMVYLETSRADARQRRELERGLASTLADVRAAVQDWPKMQEVMGADADSCPDSEGAALLRWFKDGMLTQLGHVTRQRDGSQSGALGICRKSAKVLLGPISYDRAFAWFDGQKGARVPLVVKSNQASQVHRRTPLDLFILPVIEKGRVAALSVHAGIWTSAALAASPTQVPRLRSTLVDLGKRFGFSPQGHAGKALVHALTVLPHDLLVSFSEAEIERIATASMSLTDRPRPKLALVCSPLERHLFAFAWIPRDAMSTATRQQVQTMLVAAAGAPVLDWSTEIEGQLALIRVVLDLPEVARMPDEAKLDAELKAMLRGWADAVEAEIAASEEPSRAAAIAHRYAEAFPLAYRTAYGAGEAALDIARLRRVAGEGEAGPLRDARLHRMAEDGEGVLRLKLYQRTGSLALSDAVPALENFGFRVIEDVPTELDDGRLGTIHDFLLSAPAGLDPADLLARGQAVEAALSNVLNGAAEDDPFNRLITAAALSAGEANWLRAWYRYLRQAGLNYSVPTAVDALQNAPEVSRGLIALFVARHDPAFKGDRAKAETAAQDAIRAGLAQVKAINDDRLLRQFRAVVEACLRTNAFAPAGLAALAFKLDSALVPGLPKPLPWREIFVYSRRVEGIHLRSGPVARGGLRWSDRRDDFRTEVLGLMKAQKVKNAVIVPAGAKGGFYPKQLPDPTRDRDSWLAEGKESYKLFIRTLLSITDNIVGGKVVHPAGVTIRDGEDPYFVVAADKGTATFSDTANAIADEHDFWLDDAFASGGSKGYDHKAMGITAKGAWLSVRRHFLEMGVDVQREPVLVAGCGDMSGDVFGNGMLLSKAIKLVAAFDHRHIFLDPDPDPAKSWKERDRMFALPRSSWDDYDKKLISKGGGVFARSAKEIALSKEVRALLGIEAETIDPDSLITAILKSQVDLLWFGGIGTYVKSSAENNVQVGDPANDALRIDGADLRCKVIGEGANLGTTQAGRIEFALHGGRINTDFIDNSAGVDCSDNEVNIKIALAGAKRAGRLTEPARVKLLASMTDEVSDIVLEDNRLQALALSIAQAGGAPATASHLRLIETLEALGQLDRKTEGLADGEGYVRRAADGHGLTRPELAVLLSTAKLALQAAIEASAVPDDPGLADDLLAAFPEPMRGKFKREILDHRLRREIIATKLANRVINRLGLIHPFELAEEEGANLAQVVAAFVAAERLFGMDAIWQRIETAAMSETARITLFDRAAAALSDHIADLLRVGGHTCEPSKLVAELQGSVIELSRDTESLLSGEIRAQSGRMRAQLAEAGAPAEEAALVATLQDLDGAVGIARLARESGSPARAITAAFADLGARIGLDWAQQTAARMSPSDPWERLLVNGLARDFQQMRLDFLRRVAGRKGDALAAVAAWAESQAEGVSQFRKVVHRAQAAVPVAPAMLAQLASQARNLLAR